MEGSIFRPGENCWKINHADRLSFLIDGDNYYRAFFNVINKAQSCIEIVGWELDPALNLSHIDPSLPYNLREYLDRLSSERKDLEINILVWKAFFYLRFGRERFTKVKWRFQTNSNLQYRSGRTPFFFSSYHEKVAIVDNSCAFVGGMDIAQKRWDTSSHRPNNDLRIDSNNKEYFPVHDLQVVLSGKIVKDIKKLIHKRDDAEFDLKFKEGYDLWPEDVPINVNDVTVALLRTDPKEDACEIECFYKDAINSAQDFIFIENQYITSDSVLDLLCSRLQEKNGPQIIIVTTLSYRGVFERAIYVKGRNMALKRLKAADKFNRLFVSYPSLSHQNGEKYIIVHSKLLIVDNRIMTIGSANLSNRSLKVDNEVNIAIDAQESVEIKKSIEDLLVSLLSEHLDVDKNVFSSLFNENKSLLRTVKSFQKNNKKSLREVPYLKLPFLEKILTLIHAFVDIKYAVPKRLILTLLLIILLFLYFIIF